MLVFSADQSPPPSASLSLVARRSTRPSAIIACSEPDRIPPRAQQKAAPAEVLPTAHNGSPVPVCPRLPHFSDRPFSCLPTCHPAACSSRWRRPLPPPVTAALPRLSITALRRLGPRVVTAYPLLFTTRLPSYPGSPFHWPRALLGHHRPTQGAIITVDNPGSRRTDAPHQLENGQHSRRVFFGSVKTQRGRTKKESGKHQQRTKKGKSPKSENN